MLNLRHRLIPDFEYVFESNWSGNMFVSIYNKAVYLSLQCCCFEVLVQIQVQMKRVQSYKLKLSICTTWCMESVFNFVFINNKRVAVDHFVVGLG